MQFEDAVGLHVKGSQQILIRRGGKYSEKEVLSPNPKTGAIERRTIIVPSGEIVRTTSGDNLALTRLKTQLSRLIVGHETATRFINRMAWGTGGHVPGDPSSPVPPSAGDTQLETSILVKPITTFDFPSSTSVLITAYILEGEANGFTISENALLCGDNTIVARRTFGGLAKTSDFVFEQKWLLAF